MLDKHVFESEKMSLVDFKMIKGQINTPEIFDITSVSGHRLESNLEFGFSLIDRLAKADFSVQIKTESVDKNEASGHFHFVFIYRVENLEELAIQRENEKIELHPALANALASVTYSTSRGILLTRLQGTALQNFVLPIVNPNSLFHRKND